MIQVQNTKEKKIVKNIGSAPVTTECPSCAEKLTFSKPLSLNQFLQCPACNTMLYVSSVHPINLEWLEEIEEDAAWSNEKGYTIPPHGRKNSRVKTSARGRDSFDDSDPWENRGKTNKRGKNQGKMSQNKKGQKRFPGDYE